ncbi:WxcM-like domain-containing protein [Planctomycetota bacterium]
MESETFQPKLIEGGLHVDHRGIVAFVNDFDFAQVNRSYAISFHRARELRGWIGHRQEQRWFWAVKGTVQIAVVKPDRWDVPASNLSVVRFVLSATKPQVLHIPAENAIGIVNFNADAILMVFTSGRIENAKLDDYRFSVDTWPILDIA